MYQGHCQIIRYKPYPIPLTLVPWGNLEALANVICMTLGCGKLADKGQHCAALNKHMQNMLYIPN